MIPSVERRILSEGHVWLADAASLNAWAAKVRALAESDGGIWGDLPRDGIAGTGFRLFPSTPPPGSIAVKVGGVDAWHLSGGSAVRWDGQKWIDVAFLGERPTPVLGGMTASQWIADMLSRPAPVLRSFGVPASGVVERSGGDETHEVDDAAEDSRPGGPNHYERARRPVSGARSANTGRPAAPVAPRQAAPVAAPADQQPVKPGRRLKRAVLRDE